MKLKVYFYPDSRDPTAHERDGYIDCIPFSSRGIKRWVEPTENPDRAQLFYCGQFHDRDAWKLNSNRFEYLAGRETRHIFDIEGDWRGMMIPEWLRPCISTAMNAREINRGWNIMARPGCSKLLIHLAREAPSGFIKPAKKQIWFRGQRDSLGLRKRLGNILDENFIPEEFDFSFNRLWNAHTETENDAVAAYQVAMVENAFALCPAGEGQATLRMYEACYYGRIPILVADCLWLWEDLTDLSFVLHISPAASDDEILKLFNRALSMSDSEIEDRCRMASLYFEHVVKFYFRDPTECFLTWMKKKNLI